jgi:hypothetical protein
MDKSYSVPSSPQEKATAAVSAAAAAAAAVELKTITIISTDPETRAWS